MTSDRSAELPTDTGPGEPHVRRAKSLSIALINCYELGRPSFAIASAAAWLKRSGHEVRVLDLALEPATRQDFGKIDLAIVSVPMHTALRLGQDAVAHIRHASPEAHVCFIGLYASLFADQLLESSIDSVAAGEAEPALAGLAEALAVGSPVDGVPGIATPRSPAAPHLRRVPLLVPDRSGLPPLSKHAALLGPGSGERRVAGYTEATRGCKYHCRHCPVVPVYGGRFFAVPAEVVSADIDQQVRAGAQHITFGDPDFMNGITHAMRVVRQLHADHPQVTFDITVKVEHVLQHRQHFAELRELGCLFVVSAFESLSDRVLAELDKGHTRADIFEALKVLRGAAIYVRPSLVPFTPWTGVRDYLELIEFTVQEHMTENIDPIQLAIRLLVPRGSALVQQGKEQGWLGDYEPAGLGYAWQHPDPAMDALHKDVSACVEHGIEAGGSNLAIFDEIRRLAHARAGEPAPLSLPVLKTSPVPRMSEGWFCCAEPSAAQLGRVRGCSD